MNEMNQAVLREQHFRLPDVRCAGCCLTIEKALNNMPGVTNINVNYADKRLTFTAATDDVSDLVLKKVADLGYEIAPEANAESLADFRKARGRMLARLGVAGIGMMQVMMYALASYVSGPQGIEPEYELLMRWASLVITIPVVFYAALPFHQGAFRDLRNLSAGMDVPVSLAIVSAFVLSSANTISGSGEVYFDSACMFTFFLLTGRYLELVARHSFHVDQSLGDHLLPGEARLCDGSCIALSEIKHGDVVVIEPGEIITADGVVLDGVTTVDESAFTGEADPVLKGAGKQVLAGTRNLDGRILVKVNAVQEQWVITHLGELYRKASGYKPRFAVLADHVARYFVGAVLFLAASSGLFWWWQGAENYFAIALSVLVVSCPCALSLATPVAYSIASGAAGRMGILISKGEFLEKLGLVDTVVFDKTGTLTQGDLLLRDIEPIKEAVSTEEALSIAASLEATSLHPVAKTIVRRAGSLVSADDVVVEPGLGAEGMIDGEKWRIGKPGWSANETIEAPDNHVNWVLLSRAGNGVCWFAFVDTLRPGAGKLVEDMAGIDVEVDVYTGDKSDHGRQRLESIGVSHAKTGMTPDQKMNELGSLQAAGKKVLMVGDGLNDAGAMGCADLSLAVNPVDVLVQSAADATMVSQDLTVLPMLIRFARRVRRVIRQNIIWALVYNFTVIPLAIAGLVAPWMAALGMSLSSLLVTVNATRLGRVR